MSPPIEHAGQPGFNTTSMWLLWIAASAAIPVIGVLQLVAMLRNFGHHVEAQAAFLTFTVLLLAAAPAILQWAVLRRLVPDLSFAFWVGASWISALAANFLWAAWSNSGFDGDRAFDMARLRAFREGGSAAWPWLWLTSHAALIALIYNLVPIVVLGWLAKRSSRAFLVATILGACAAVLLHKLYFSFTHLQVSSLYEPVDFGRAQSSWRRLAEIMATVGVFGMVQGAVGGYGLMRMFAPASEPQIPGAGSVGAAAVLRVFGLVAVVLLTAHGLRFAIGPLGVQAGFPELRKMFSSAPASDRSAGMPILNFSHKIVLPMPVRFVVPGYDGRTALLLTKEALVQNQSLRRLDVEKRVLDDTPLVSGGSTRAVAFSPDGRHVAVIQEGRHRRDGDYPWGRVRLFATDGFAEVKDFRAEDPDCAFSSKMTFSEDSRALWVLCEWSRAARQNLLAVSLQLPDLRVVERLPLPDGAATRASTPLGEIVADGSGTFVAAYAWDEATQYLSVFDVMKNAPPLASRSIAPADLGAPGFGFCGLHLSRAAKLVTLAHCAVPPALPKSDLYRTAGQFRTFDMDTGRLAADFGKQVPGEDIVQWSVAFDRAHGRFAGIGTTLASKGGTLVVWDQETGRELQRMETAAYRSGAFSLDGLWLLLVGRDDDAIYVYRARP